MRNRFSDVKRPPGHGVAEMVAGLRWLLWPLSRFLRQSLSMQILEGLLAGVIAGLMLPVAIVSLLAPIGEGFLRLFQMPVVPFLSISLVAGVGRLELGQASRLLCRAAIVLMGFWVVVLGAVLLIPLGFPDWREASFFRPSLLEAAKPMNLIELFIPVNPFAAFADTQIPAVVLFSIALGIALISVPKRQGLIEVLDRVQSALLKISAYIARYTPLGVFAILASTTSQVSPSEIPRLAIYIVLQGGVAVVLTFLFLPYLVQAVIPIKAGELIKSFRTPLLIAFSTANLLVVLPLLINQGKQLLIEGMARQRSLGLEDRESRKKLAQSIELPVEVLTPLALVFPDMGRVLSLAFVPFAGWLTGNPLTVEQMPSFLITGLASTFLEGVLAMTFLLSKMGLPTDMVNLYIALDQLAVARLGTLLACMSVISLVLVGTWISLEGFRYRLSKLLPVTISMLIIPIFISVSRFILNQIPQPSNPYRSQLETQGFVLAKEKAELIEEPKPLEEAGIWPSMQARGAIRYCIHKQDYPMAYRNAKQELVGADVETGLLFAEDMGIKASLIQIDHLGNPNKVRPNGLEALKNELCDLKLSSDIIVPQESAEVLYTSTNQSYGIGLLLKGSRFSSKYRWKEIKAIKGFRVGLEAHSPYSINWVQRLLPHAILNTSKGTAELLKELKNDNLDAVIISAQKGAAWNVLEPSLTLLVPKPTKSLPTARQVPEDAIELSRVWNHWLKLQGFDGTKNKVYQHWVEGIADEEK